jgi:hypothetical protein
MQQHTQHNQRQKQKQNTAYRNTKKNNTTRNLTATSHSHDDANVRGYGSAKKSPPQFIIPNSYRTLYSFLTNIALSLPTITTTVVPVTAALASNTVLLHINQFLSESIATKIRAELPNKYIVTSPLFSNSTAQQQPLIEIYASAATTLEILQHTADALVYRMLFMSALQKAQTAPTDEVEERKYPNVTYYMLNHNKVIDYRNAIAASVPFKFTTDSINSGYYHNNAIVIYRIEEFAKVLLHELAHFYTLDIFNATAHSTTNSAAITTNIINTEPLDVYSTVIKQYWQLPESNEYRFNEAIAEWWAIIISISFISATYAQFTANLKKQLNWNFFQIAKIVTLSALLSHAKKRNNTTRQFSHLTAFAHLQQDTDVFSYFILKTALLLHNSPLITRNTSNANTKQNSLKNTKKQYQQQYHSQKLAMIKQIYCNAEVMKQNVEWYLVRLHKMPQMKLNSIRMTVDL